MNKKLEKIKNIVRDLKDLEKKWIKIKWVNGKFEIEVEEKTFNKLQEYLDNVETKTYNHLWKYIVERWWKYWWVYIYYYWIIELDKEDKEIDKWNDYDYDYDTDFLISLWFIYFLIIKNAQYNEIDTIGKIE